MHASSFKNCAESVIAFLDTSKSTLIAGVCWFTHPLIFEALQKACARKIQVKLLLDYDHINFQPRGLDFLTLEKAGAAVMAYTGPGLLHHKFAVADGCRVLTGSYNWTRAEQLDHVVVVHDVDLAHQFTQAFAALASKCQPIAVLRNLQPRHLSFSQLYRPALWSMHDLRRSVVSGAKTWLVVAKTTQEWNHWHNHQRHSLSLKQVASNWPCTDILDEPTLRHWLAGTSLRPATRTQLTRYGLRLRIGDILVAATPLGTLLGAGIVGSDAEILADKPCLISRFVQWLPLDAPTIEPLLKLPTLRSGIMRYHGSALELIAKMEPNI